MARIGEAVGEHAVLAAFLHQRLVDVLGHRERAHRHVGRGDRLGHRDGRGLDAEGLRAPPVAGAGEAADHLVGDEGDVVLGQHRLHLLEIGLGRHQHAARAHHRLGDEGGDRLGSLALDHRLQVARQPAGVLLLALAGLGILANSAGSRCAGRRAIGRSKSAWNTGMPDRLAAGDGGAVIAALARDDLLLLRAPAARCCSTRRS